VAGAVRANGRLGAFAFYGWRVVLVLTATRLVAGGIGIYGRGVFLIPMETDLGVSRDAISLMFALLGLLVGVMAPVAGIVVQRHGGRRVMFWGSISSGVGYILLFWVHSLLALGLVFGLLITLSFNWAYLQASTAITNAWFIKRKALALSLLSAGIGLGGLLVVPALQRLVSSQGWRVGAVVCGVLIILIACVAVVFIRDTPEEKGMNPDGNVTPRSRNAAPMGSEGSLTLREASRTPFFWLLLTGTVLWLSLYSSIGLHFIPILISKGESPDVAAWLLGLYAIATMPMSLAVGWLSDRFDGNLVLAMFAVSLAAAAGVLLFTSSIPGYLAVVLLVSPVESIWAVLWALLGRAYGRRYYDTIRGTIYGLILVLSAAWTWLPGLVFARTGVYDQWLVALVVLMLGTAATFVVASRLPVRRRPGTP